MHTITKRQISPSVLVVDDDAAVRESLRWLLESEGMIVRTYASAVGLTEQADWDDADCILLDVRMPQIDGLALQERLRQHGIDIPVIIITGHADVPTAVRALKNGAADFIEKPFDDELLLDSIRRAMRRKRKARAQTARRNHARARIQRLTPRERQVFDLVVAGWTNKDSAAKLGIAEKTIEAHRASLRGKLRVDTLADIVRLAAVADERNKL